MARGRQKRAIGCKAGFAALERDLNQLSNSRVRMNLRPRSQGSHRFRHR
jgi:hypothetical protein